MEKDADDSTNTGAAEEADPLLAAIGRRIREVREAKDRGVTETADAAGIKKGHLWRAEAGQHNMTVRTLSRIATALDTTMSTLLHGVGRPKARQAVKRSTVRDDGGPAPQDDSDLA